MEERRKNSEISPMQPVIVSSFDRSLRIILFCMNVLLFLAMLWVIALVNRNYSFGTGNRDVSCATARVVLEQHYDPDLRYQIDEHCK